MSQLNKPSHLKIDGISVRYAEKTVLSNVSFIVNPGQRVGLIGENGSGKSSLLRVIAKTDPGRIGLLQQVSPFEENQSVSQAIRGALQKHYRVAQELEVAGQELGQNPQSQAALENYGHLLVQAEQLNIWDLEARTQRVLAGFGLNDIPVQRHTGELSGGQRARLGLAWFLLNSPEVLLLDEPTNHLDDASQDHLIKLLTDFSGPVLVASHDRSFLDACMTSIIDLDPAMQPHQDQNSAVSQYTGNYSNYLTAREDSRQRWVRQYESEQAELRRLVAGVKSNQNVGHDTWKPRTEVRISQKFYGDRNARVVSRRVNDVRSKLEKLTETQIRKPPKPLVFQGFGALEDQGPAGASGKELTIQAKDLWVDARLAPVSFSIGFGEKWLFTGPNGAGKSTLLKVLLGELEPSGGSLQVPGRAAIGLLTQDVNLPDPMKRGAGRTVLRTYTDLIGQETSERVPLDSFGLLHPRDFLRPLETLSVGQQRRLELAVLLADPPPILLLDEPTNHFSLSIIEALETAIIDYSGTVVLTSHDRWLRSHLQIPSIRLALPK